MLVLTRRVGESLVIGDDIVVTVLEVRSDGVRLGIDAPRHVRVHRAEVLDAVRVENVTAVQADDDAVAALRDLVPRSGHGAAAPDAAGGQGAPAQG
ncbi:MAG: carbon storage regulator CsrA [Cellulomonas sp.]|jgi:carbon storage regulator|uniref:carbon storage regulator CsrA n=1 Tax=Cellulomonas sp. TaxID=40001 RepID=UPI001A0B759F|nr:carbon storage regulator CsrA [Cellulomonas sp.]MBF0689168.1 carbon storage regulator CsrA [Cellulomonas sp.]